MQSCWRSPNATACSGEPADGSGTSKEEKELDEHENQYADEVLEVEERIDEILLRQYKFTSRKLELTTEVKIDHSCCKKLAAQLKKEEDYFAEQYEQDSDSENEKESLQVTEEEMEKETRENPAWAWLYRPVAEIL